MPTDPYYQDDYCTVYHGDCLDIMGRLADTTINLIITDPPYGLNFNNGDLAHNWEKVFGGDTTKSVARPIANDGWDEAMGVFEAFLCHAKRLLKPGSCCCCCCCGGGGPKPLFAHWTLAIDAVLNFKQAVVWDKGGLGMGLHYRRNYEFMLVGQKPGAACTWNGGNSTPNIVKIGRIIPSKTQHPTAKPVELMAHFIHLHSNLGDAVLDPFMGHGPTLRAAKDLGRKAIGIEIEEKYCEIAAKRLEQEVLAL